MIEHNIIFLLVQIDEAHSTKWPIGLINTPEPQISFSDRIKQANDFVLNYDIGFAFKILIDGWDNLFAETFRAWPDKYYFIDNTYKILGKSEYGRVDKGEVDALIKYDCCQVINDIINKQNNK